MTRPNFEGTAFVPGLDPRGAAELARALLSSGAASAVEERVVYGADGALAR